jgi:nucleotide-binding universal stress UspA family protein
MYHRILVPIDGSAASQRGLKEAIQFAKCLGGQLRLFHMASEQILDCGYGSGTYGGELIESARKEGRHILSEAEASVRREGLQAETVMVESMNGSAAASILAQAKEWPADLIVMGTHGRRGLVRLAMGSDAESVVRETLVPVLLVHDVSLPKLPVADETIAAASEGQVLYA